MNRQHKNKLQWWRAYSCGITLVLLTALTVRHAAVVIGVAKVAVDLLWQVKREVIELMLVLGAAIFRHGKR
jgi:hypothetical protein